MREIMREEAEQIWWRDYSLSDGQPLGRSFCSRKHMARWATRKATAEEVARLQKQLWQPIEQEEREFISGMVEKFVRGMSDATLLAEVRRRGLRLEE